MMTMSKALSAGQAKDYYQQEFISAKENYYSESGEVRGQWYGRLAEEWGLKGEVGSEQYERLVAGQDPRRIAQDWQQDVEKFQQMRQKYLIYK